MITLFARIRGFWRGLTRSAALDADMAEEMRFHIDMEADRLARAGQLDPVEARRRACAAFGGLEKYKEEGRDTRQRRWLDALWLDTRLGVRMLLKHRGLTLVGGFAMTVAIAIGATFFEIFGEMLTPALPFEGGARIVALQYATASPGNPERRVLHDFVEWRQQLQSIEQLGAFRTVQHNLVSGTTTPEPVKVAEITASGFSIAATPPLLGRYLLREDERAAAPAVAVIGYQAWHSRFAGDAQILGREITLGGVVHTIVGVMPEGFHFPVDHQFWTALRANPLHHRRLQGPALSLFGRLAPGVTLTEAQAELTTVGRRTASLHPDLYAHLRPILIPYTREHLDIADPALVLVLRIGQLLVGALAFVVAVNLAILIYARTVTRLGEIAVRTALGASRRRILVQLFIEAVVLTLLGAGTGLALADVALNWMQSLARLNGSVPFWITFRLSPWTVAYALGLAATTALVMGVLPGLKATRARIIDSLHELNGRSGTRLGPVWTTLVVAQVAVAVAVLPVAAFLARQALEVEVSGSGIAADDIVVGTAVFGEADAATAREHLARGQRALVTRLEQEPGVAAVTFSSGVPGFAGDGSVHIDGDPSAEPHDVSVLDVEPRLFAVYDVEIIAGRSFAARDLGTAHVAIVNRTFAERFFAGRSPLGGRFRYSASAAEESPAPPVEYEIVGVVRDFPKFPPGLSLDAEPVVYHPVEAGALTAMVMSVRFNGAAPAGFADRLRAIGAEVDPALQLRRVRPLSAFYGDVRSFWRYIAWGTALLTSSVLLLSAAGIYALMSFTVAQRTREIGIRSALGAHPRRLLLNVFARVLQQLTLGITTGSLLSAAALYAAGLTIGHMAWLLLPVTAVMLSVGAAAAFGPARRSLRIPAIDALRADV